MERRRVIKAAAVLTTLSYCSLLVYQGTGPSNAQDLRQGRAYQLSDLYIEPVTKTSVSEKKIVKNITLDDVFISVKTSKHYENTRLPIILKTWFQLAKEQTWFFTDTDNQQHQNLTNGHMVNTKCPSSHSRKHLCCKTALEYDHFIKSDKKWFCHFDDDNYVNVPRLVSVLQEYNPQMDWYLGRTSVYKPVKRLKSSKVSESFWFATGGAGFCISRSLGLKMLPIASGHKFESLCEKIRYPDDITVGYIIEYKLKRKLTRMNEFHSHLEPMKLLNPKTLKDQVSFGYSKVNGEWNVVNVAGFSNKYDPTRFLSLHCFLFPYFKFCPR